MAGAVVIEKVRRPEVGGLRRRRLVDRLPKDGGPHIGLVVAPAGSGKTTLLAHASAARACPCGWYRAGPGETREQDLVQHLLAALRDVLGPGARATGVDALLGLLDDRIERDAVLVVDDLHELAGTVAETALARVLELCPSRLRVLLASRRRPAMNLSRLQVAGRLVQLDGEDLRFRSWEVERLFLEVYGEPLPPESAAALARRTEGWAAGLQLFHLATSGQTTAQRRDAVSMLGGRSRLVRSYLADNVLTDLPPARRDFLVRTCTLGRLSGALCDALLRTTGSHTVLRELEEAQLFTTSDDDRAGFRYHQVLRDHLEVALHEEMGSAGLRDWFSRSGEVLEQAGHLPEAVRAYARAEDWASAARVLARAGTAVEEGPHVDLDGLVPAAMRDQDPWLLIAHARRRLRTGDLRRAVCAFRRAQEMLPDERSRRWCRREGMRADVWLGPPPAYAVRGPGPMPDARHWTEHLREITFSAHPDPPDHIPGSPDERLRSGMRDVVAGRLGDGRRRLAEVADEVDAGSARHLTALTACGLVDHLLEGRTDRLEEATLAADVAGLAWLGRLTRALLVLAAAPDDDPVPEARCRGWRHTLAECEADGDAWGSALLQLMHGAAGALGCLDVDPSVLPGAAAAFRELGATALATWAEALHALDLARSGDDDAARVARHAEVLGRRHGVPGARSVAATVLAGYGGSTHRARWRRLAEELADECGLPRAPGRVALPDRGPGGGDGRRRPRHPARRPGGGGGRPGGALVRGAAPRAQPPASAGAPDR